MSIACDNVNGTSNGQCVSVQSQDKIEWLEKPHMVGDNLVMKGRVLGGAQLHSVGTPYRGSIRAAFTLNKAEDLEALMGIVPAPKSLGAILQQTYDASLVYAETYEIGPDRSTFYVEAKLPSHLKRAVENDVELIVVVWEQYPQLEGPLGYECIAKGES